MESEAPVLEAGPGERKRKFDNNQLGRMGPGRNKRTSMVWNFFNPLHREETDVPRCICILCHAVFKTPQSSTTSMRSHLQRKHPEVLENVLVSSSAETTLELEDPLNESTSQNSRYSSIGEIGDTEIFEETLITDEEYEEESNSAYSNIYSNSSETMFDQVDQTPPQVSSQQHIINVENTTRSIVHYIASNMLPMKSVSNSSFQNLVSNLNMGYTLAVEESEQNFSSRVVTMMESVCTKTKAKLSLQLAAQDVSIGLKLWVKTNQKVYLLVTCNYIDNWVQRTVYLGMRLLPKISLRSVVSTFEETVSNVLGDILNDYKIPRNRVMCIVISTYPLNIDNKLTILGKSTVPCFNFVLRQCYSKLTECITSLVGVDVIETISKKCVDYLPDLDELTYNPGKLLVATKNYLNTSETNADLPESVTQNMESIIHLQDRLSAYVEGSLEQPIISGSSIFPLISGVDKFFRESFQTEENSNPSDNKWTTQTKQGIAMSITESIQSQFKINLQLSDLGDATLVICTFFDPRYKSLTFLTQEQRQLVHDLVMRIIGKLTPIPPQAASSLPKRSNYYINQDQQSTTSFTNSRLTTVLNAIMTRTDVLPVSSVIQGEFIQYLEESSPLMDTNPLEWWASRQRKYRNLARVARKYLCISGTATDAKFIFTSAGSDLNNRMSLIEPEFVDKIVFLEKHQEIFKDDDQGEVQFESEITTTIQSRIREPQPIIVKVESTTADNEVY